MAISSDISVIDAPTSEIDNQRLLSVSSITVNEASLWAVFTVRGTAHQPVTLSILQASTESGAADLGDKVGIEIWTGSEWVAYSTTTQIPDTGLLSVRVAITNTQDDAYQGERTFQLLAALDSDQQAAGTATIVDDGTGTIFDASGNEDTTSEKDDDRLITVSSPIVNEASPYAVFFVRITGGGTIRLSLLDGTAFGKPTPTSHGTFDFIHDSLQYSLDHGESWNSYTGPFSITPGTDTTEFVVRNELINDAIIDNNESFTLFVESDSGLSLAGKATIKDDGTGTIFNANGSDNPVALKDDEYSNLSAALEARASWMINTYRNFTIGAPNAPNGLDGQKFGWADILSRLHLNPNDRAPIQRFLNLFKAGNVNAAFMPAGAGWILSQYWDKFTPQERNTIILPVLKKADLLRHGTENIFLIKYVGAYLFSQLWPSENGWQDSIRRRRLTSAELAEFTKSRLLATLKSYYSKGYHENLSPNYLTLHFYALHALYNSTTDPELKAAADAALTFHVADMAANFFQGATIAPYNRPAPSPISDAPRNVSINNHIKALYWLYWAEFMNTPSTTTAIFSGFGPNAGARDEAKHFAVTSALSSWRPPALFTALAQGSGIGPYTLQSSAPAFGEFATGAPGATLRTVYREERFAVGSGMFRQRINNGLSEIMGMEIVYKTTDNQNSIAIHHPYWRTNSNQYKWLSRSSPFQQTVQHQSTLISLFNIPKADPFAGRTRPDFEAFRNQNRFNLIQQAWIRYPKAADEVVQTRGWIFLREDQTFIALRPWNPYTINTVEFPDLNVVNSPGATNAVISDIATVEQFPKFSDFRSAVLASPLTVNLNTPTPNVSYRNVRGDTITARWSQQDYTAAQITSWPTLTVNGVVQRPDPDFIEGRAVIKSDPLTLANRVLTVNLPSGSYEVDWRNTMPIFNNSNYRSSFARPTDPVMPLHVAKADSGSLLGSKVHSSDHKGAHAHGYPQFKRNQFKSDQSAVSRSRSRSSNGIETSAIISRGWARSLWNFSGRDGIVDYHVNDGGRGRGNLPMSPSEAGFIRDTFKLLDRLTGLSFVERKTASSADIRVNCASKLGGSQGLAYRANGWFDVYWKDKSGWDLTRFEKHLIRHEIAHTLGLEHPYGVGANPRYDTKDTVMSYNWRGNTNYTDSDISALRELWGA
jgi:hypothetical protein